MQTKTCMQFLCGAVVGGSIAALAALLLTPVSGEDARKKLLESLPGNLASGSHAKHYARRAVRSVPALKAHKAKKHRNSD